MSLEEKICLIKVGSLHFSRLLEVNPAEVWSTPPRWDQERKIAR